MTVVCSLITCAWYILKLAYLLFLVEQQMLSESKDIKESSMSTFNNITLGARQKSITVQDLLKTRVLDDIICRQFQDNLQKFLLAELGGEVPEDNLTVHSTTKVCAT